LSRELRNALGTSRLKIHVESHALNQVISRVQVPNDRVGAVIGKHGAEIKKIQLESSTKLIFNEMKSSCSYRLLKIVGNLDGVGAAIKVICIDFFKLI
jgi:hypothetical protein